MKRLCSSLDLVWEHMGLEYKIGSHYPFVVDLSKGDCKTKPFGLVSKEFDMDSFLETNAHHSRDGLLVIWSQIVDMKIDRRGRTYPIVKPVLTFDENEMQRLGVSQLLEEARVPHGVWS